MKIKKIIAGLAASVLTLAYAVWPQAEILTISELTANAEEDDMTYNEEIKRGKFGYEKVDEDSDGNYDYVIINDFYEVSAAEITIPDKIEDLTVKGISDFALSRVVNKVSVLLSEGIESLYVGKYAFITEQIVYRNVIKPSGESTLEGVIRYFLDDLDFGYSEENMKMYTDYALSVVENAYPGIDVASIPLERFFAILLKEIIYGRTELSQINVDNCKFFLNSFSYADVELVSCYNNNMERYAKSKASMKYTKGIFEPVDSAGISVGNITIEQGDTEAYINISVDNIKSAGCNIYIYSDQPVEILEIDNALTSERSYEYGDSCIHGIISSDDNSVLENVISLVKISVPDNIPVGTYPIYILIENLKNEKGSFVVNPIAVNGSVTVNEKIITTEPTTVTTTETTTIETTTTTTTEITTTAAVTEETTAPTTTSETTTAETTTTAEETTVTTTTTPETTTVTETTRPVIKGDISGNGVIDLYDAIAIAESLVGKRTFTDEEKETADINGDGKVNLYDAIYIATLIIHRG